MSNDNPKPMKAGVDEPKYSDNENEEVDQGGQT